MAHILIIDDERLATSYYIRALESAGYKVTHKDNTDDAIEFIQKNVENISAIVLDIMMEPGKAFEDDEHDEGMNTGILFFELLKDKYPDIPIFPLSSRTDKDTKNYFLRENTGIPYYEKLDNTPNQFAKKVRVLLEKKFGA